jgi:2-oxoisovalerate dehydrogenase E2 component (dihydrolipoyl transacylase)
MLPFFIKACSLAMNEYPIVNSHIDNDLDEDGYIQRYVIKHDHNFSIAIDSPDGLTVPGIKQVQNKSVLAINTEIKELAEKAKNGGLTKADFEDATFSVSSVGNIGGRYFVPTILRPQAAIIAIGQAHKTAKYVEDLTSADGYRWEPQDSINFSISADHRVLDGATVARFSSKMK